MEWITGDILKQLAEVGTWPLAGIFFMLGWIRPRSAVTEIREDRDARIAEVSAERDDWKEAHRLSELAREKLKATNHEQLELTRAAVDALRGFRMAASWLEQERGGSGEVVPPKE